jgi:hypothetical protein
MGRILDTVVVSHAIVMGMTCEELGRRINMGLLRFYYALKGPIALPPRLLHHGAIKMNGRPHAPLCPLAQAVVAS